MPLTYEDTFRVRSYECDPREHLSHVSYLRYMQEIAFDASASVGYDLQRYERMKRFWLVHDTEIEYFGKLNYGEAVRIKTWVASARRVRSHRMYEFHNVKTGELVARAYSDWVYVDADTRKLVTIPPEIVTAFFPAGETPPIVPRSKFPEPPPPPARAFKTRRRVEWRDIDHAQHVNNTVYLEYMEDAGLHAAASHGWAVTRMAAEGYMYRVKQHRLEYLQPALLHEELDMMMWVSNVKRDTFTCHYNISRAKDDTLLMRGRSVCLWLDIVTGQPTPIPRAIMSDCAPLIV